MHCIHCAQHLEICVDLARLLLESTKKNGCHCFTLQGSQHSGKTSANMCFTTCCLFPSSTTRGCTTAKHTALRHTGIRQQTFYLMLFFRCHSLSQITRTWITASEQPARRPTCKPPQSSWRRLTSCTRWCWCAMASWSWATALLPRPASTACWRQPLGTCMTGSSWMRTSECSIAACLAYLGCTPSVGHRASHDCDMSFAPAVGLSACSHTRLQLWLRRHLCVHGACKPCSLSCC